VGIASPRSLEWWCGKLGSQSPRKPRSSKQRARKGHLSMLLSDQRSTLISNHSYHLGRMIFSCWNYQHNLEHSDCYLRCRNPQTRFLGLAGPLTTIPTSRTRYHGTALLCPRIGCVNHSDSHLQTCRRRSFRIKLRLAEVSCLDHKNTSRTDCPAP